MSLKSLIAVLLVGFASFAAYNEGALDQLIPALADRVESSDNLQPNQPLEGDDRDFAPSTPHPTDSDHLTICSFNIKWLGHYKKKDDVALADILRPYDVVLVQELVAPPFNGRYPDGTTFDADEDSVEFFQVMSDNGFDFVLSEEDTGTNPEIHTAGAGTEWWAAFYKPNVVELAPDLPSGFLAQDRSDHPDFERVPYAFPFRTTGGETDFVLVSVHLEPGSSGATRRAEEFEAIFSWIDANNSVEKDFLVVGDMNIHSEDELTVWESAGWLSLNDEMRKTNTSPNSDQAYDHVLYDPRYSTEVDERFDLVVVDLVEEMRGRWTSTEPYPGDPYDGNLFGQYYSDHHPVVFRMALPSSDDD